MHAKRAMAIVLVIATSLPLPVLAAAPAASLQGRASSVTGSPLANLDLELIHVESGAVRAVRTDAAGSFSATLEPGSYSIEPRGGYTIVRGPRLVTLVPGEVTGAEIALTSQEPELLSSGARTTGAANGMRTGNVVAVALFSGALAAVAIRAATVKRVNPSPSR